MYAEGKSLSNGCPELRLVLLGSIGCGKTLTADTILGEQSPSTAYSSSRICQVRSGLSEGRRLTLVETPRWYWSGGQVEGSVQLESKRALHLSAPGPHAFFLLIPVGQFTEVERQVPTQMEELFGKEVLGHTMVLFTCGDYLVGRPVEEYLANEDPGLREVLNRCEGQYHVINNRRLHDREQVRTLLDKVQDMVQSKGGCYVQRTEQIEVEDQVRIRKRTAQDRQNDDVERRWGLVISSQTLGQQRKDEFDLINGRDGGDWEVEDTVFVTRMSNGLNSPALTQEAQQQTLTSKDSREKKASFRLSADGALLSQLLEERPSTSYVNTVFHRISSHVEEPIPVTLSPTSDSSHSHSFPTPPSPSLDDSQLMIPEFRLLLLGRKGAGKRDVANCILGSDAFVTPEGTDVAACQECERKRTVVAGKKMTVVDTPDWLHSDHSLENMQQDLTSGLSLLAPGPHAFLLCVPVDQPVDTELRALGAMEKVLGPAALWGHTLLIFTHSNRLDTGVTGLEEYIASQRPDLLQLVEKCSDRYHVLDMGGVDDLLQKVEQTVRENGGSCFSQELNQQRRATCGEEVNQWTNSPYLQVVREEDEGVEDKDYASGRTEKRMDQSATPASLSSSQTSASTLDSMRERLVEMLMRIPKLLAGGALLGGIVGVYLAGPLGGAVGATVGTVATEVGRRKYSSKMKMQ